MKSYSVENLIGWASEDFFLQKQVIFENALPEVFWSCLEFLIQMTMKVEGEGSVVLDIRLLAVLHRQHLGDFWIYFF